MIEIKQYIDTRKNIHEVILTFIEDDGESSASFQNLNNLFNTEQIREDREKLREILHLISKIHKNHHRQTNFNKNIEQILLYLSENIKQFFSNSEIFNFFKSSKRILLFLFEKEIIVPDEYIINYILKKGSNYFIYFFTKIKPFLNDEFIQKIEKEIDATDPQIMIDFEKKLEIGENDSYICNLMRNDSIEQFIIFVNQTNYNLSNQIKPSIFETNSFLIKNNETTLIEYAVFFGSIQIFQYLRFNNVKLEPSLWLYAIHSKNNEIIHLLEENHIEPPNNSYNECFIDIANYIKDNLITNFNENNISHYFHYYNFFYFQESFFNHKKIFFYICEYDYFILVKLLLLHKKIDLKETIIIKSNYFLSNS